MKLTRPAAPMGIAAALTLITGLALGGWFYGYLHRPYAGWSGESVIVNLSPGLDAGSMLRELADAGVVRRAALLRRWLSLKGAAGKLRAGEYAFEAPISPAEVLERLERGDVVLHPVTLPEGLTLGGVAERLSEAGLGDPQALLDAFRDTSLIRDLDPAATDLEGYLFPDTYRFASGEPPSRIARAMVERFREVLDPDYRRQAELAGLDLRGAVVLASLIERETSVPTERARISRVFHNRLARGMRLECDPTVLYALERKGLKVERLTYADLKVDSPWNTYVTKGLPLGPIANPGRESLIAAVRPADGEAIYFVAAPDGGHRFSNTLSEHLRNVAEWRRYVRSSR